MQARHGSAKGAWWPGVGLVAVLFGVGVVGVSQAAVPQPASVARGGVAGVSEDGRLLSCGEIACETDADCPGNCGGCSSWSKTCYAF